MSLIFNCETDQLKIETAAAQLGPRLSPAIKGAIILRFVLANRVTMRIDIMTGCDKSLQHPLYHVVSSYHHLSPRPSIPLKVSSLSSFWLRPPTPPNLMT